jgi:hypothetical protein
MFSATMERSCRRRKGGFNRYLQNKASSSLSVFGAYLFASKERILPTASGHFERLDRVLRYCYPLPPFKSRDTKTEPIIGSEDHKILAYHYEKLENDKDDRCKGRKAENTLARISCKKHDAYAQGKLV